MAEHSPFLQTALEAARAADAVVKRYYRSNVAVQTKADRTPVTEADIETEKTIKKIILDAFPEHGFFGEETGKTNAEADYLWLIDPIDGTKSFVRQYPFFSTQIALMHKGELILGVSNGTMFDELCWAEKGGGAWMNGERLQVAAIDDLRDAALSMANLTTIAGSADWARVGKLVTQMGRVRGYGDFYHYHLLAAGKIDIILESDLNILDIGALTVIMREAGAVVTQLDGGPIGLETRSMLATTPVLRAQVESIMGLAD